MCQHHFGRNRYDRQRARHSDEVYRDDDEHHRGIRRRSIVPMLFQLSGHVARTGTNGYVGQYSLYFSWAFVVQSSLLFGWSFAVQVSILFGRALVEQRSLSFGRAFGVQSSLLFV